MSLTLFPDSDQEHHLKKSNRTAPGWRSIWLLFTSFLLLAGAFNGARADSLDTWQWRNPLPEGNTLSYVVYGDNTFVALGPSTTLTSTDGVIWNSTDTAPSTTFTSLGYLNGLFMGTANQGVILTSSDGFTWTPQNSGVTRDLFDATYGDGSYVAVGAYGTILTSPDGVNWSGRNTGTGYDLDGVAYGNGLFVAAGNAGTVLTSTDAATWAASQPPTTEPLTYITYGAGLFLALGGSSGDVYTSTNGLSWSQGGDVAGANALGLAYQNGLFVAINAAHAVLTSTNGTSWTTSSPGVVAGVAYGSGTYVAVGTETDSASGNQYGGIWTSPNATAWTSQNSAITYQDLEAMAYCNDTFVMVGKKGTIISSLDCQYFTPRASGGSDLYGITYGNGVSVVVGDGTILSSSDEVTWSQTFQNNLYNFQGVAYGSGTFVAVGANVNGNGEYVAAASTDGVNWGSTIISSTSNIAYSGFSLYGVAYGNSAFVAVGYYLDQNSNPHADTFSSPDGQTWTESDPGIPQELSGVAYLNGVFVAVGANGTILSSTDGAAWTSGSSGVTTNLTSVAVGSSYLVAAGDNGTLLSSTDGLTWTARNTGVTNPPQFNGIGYGWGTFVALGNAGAILQSEALEGVGPIVTTGTVASLTATTAVLSGTVNPNGPASVAYFEYATNPQFVGASYTGNMDLASGTDAIAVSDTVENLLPSQTYYFRAEAYNVDALQYGATVTFTTPEQPPVITSSTSATGFNASPFSYQITATQSPTSFSATDLPDGLGINTSTGLISGTVDTTGTYTASIIASNTAGSGTANLIITIVNPPPPVITSTNSATGETEVNFGYQITASNGPTSFSAADLPSGLALNSSTGLISGTPVATGTFYATIGAINYGGTGTAILTVTIIPGPPAINSSLAATGTEGSNFSYQITASNNPTGFNAAGLPGGLHVNNTGLIDGAPTQSGTFAVTISASNTSGTGSASLSLVVVLPNTPLITSALGATGTTGYSFSYYITASGNPTSFVASGLPPGVGYNASTGLISGIPVTSGTYVATIGAINPGGTGSAFLTITVLPRPPEITSSINVTGAVDSPFTYQITASQTPTSFNATNLPPGLTVSPSTGTISGTPTESGTFAATISAANAGGTGSAILSLGISVNFAAVKGSYVGLDVVGGTNAGLFTMSISNRGHFTAKLTLPGGTYPFSAALSPYGIFTGSARAGKNSVTADLVASPSGPAVSGTVTVITNGGNLSTEYAVGGSLLGKFKAGSLPAGLAGNYTVILPPVSGTDPSLPPAPGYGTMRVTSAGAIQMKGKLGDGTAITTRAQLHADGKTWTLFSLLYHGKNPGSIAGTITFESLPGSDCDGSVDWIKPGQTSGAYYASGFSEQVDFLGANYAAPALTITTGTFTLDAGNLPAPIADGFTVSREKVTVTGTNGVTLTLTPSTGAFSGKFLYPDTGKKTPFGGVIYQKPATVGFGLFLGSDESGSVELSP